MYMTLKMGVKMIPKRDQKPDTDRQLLYRERDRLLIVKRREGITLSSAIIIVFTLFEPKKK